MTALDKFNLEYENHEIPFRQTLKTNNYKADQASRFGNMVRYMATRLARNSKATTKGGRKK